MQRRIMVTTLINIIIYINRSINNAIIKFIFSLLIIIQLEVSCWDQDPETN